VRTARFEDLPVWQKAMELAIEIRRLLPLIDDENDAIARELSRSSVAVPSRIARGHGMGTRKGWMHGLSAAAGAAARTEAALTLGIQLGRFAGDDAITSLLLVRDISRMLDELESA
jgi:four helix bundle protein